MLLGKIFVGGWNLKVETDLLQAQTFAQTEREIDKYDTQFVTSRRRALNVLLFLTVRGVGGKYEKKQTVGEMQRLHSY